MKSIIAILLLLAVFSMLPGCMSDGRKSFSLSIVYSSPWGFPLKYQLTQQSIIVNKISDKNGKVVKEVYIRYLKKGESDSIYNFLRSIPYDTLKKSYENLSYFDGIDKIIAIRGKKMPSKRVLVYMCATRITDTLESLVQNLVLTEGFKRENW